MRTKAPTYPDGCDTAGTVEYVITTLYQFGSYKTPTNINAYISFCLQ